MPPDGDVAYPVPSTPHASVVMRSNRKVDSRPEVRLRAALHGRGLRFRKHHLIRLHNLTVRPDVVFPGLVVALFVDGCFWHGCQPQGNVPEANHEYWSRKLERNASRDRTVDLALLEGGWTVIRVWEHEPLQAALDRVFTILTDLGGRRRSRT